MHDRKPILSPRTGKQQEHPQLQNNNLEKQTKKKEKKKITINNNHLDITSPNTFGSHKLTKQE